MDYGHQMQLMVLQGSVLSPTLYNIYTDNPLTKDAHLAVFANDTCLYAANHTADYILKRLQRSLDSMVVSCERWNFKINED
jgi:hypothetical protein